MPYLERQLVFLLYILNFFNTERNIPIFTNIIILSGYNSVNFHIRNFELVRNLPRNIGIVIFGLISLFRFQVVVVVVPGFCPHFGSLSGNFPHFPSARLNFCPNTCLCAEGYLLIVLNFYTFEFSAGPMLTPYTMLYRTTIIWSGREANYLPAATLNHVS